MLILKLVNLFLGYCWFDVVAVVAVVAVVVVVVFFNFVGYSGDYSFSKVYFIIQSLPKRRIPILIH